MPVTPVDVFFRGDWGADGYVYGNNHGKRTLHWWIGRVIPRRWRLPARSYLNPRLSPDGLLAVEVEGPNHDFYVHDFARRFRM